EDVGQWLWAHGRQPMELLAAARVFMLLGVTLALTAAAWFATRLIGVPAALLGFLLIASDPFHIALTRLLHLDGLVSSLMLLSLLAFLSYLHRGRRRLDLVISAIAAGAACLTKSPAIFLAPFATLLVLLELWSKSRAAGRLDRAALVWGVQSLLLWALLSLAVFVLLWPAMWVAPLNAVTQIVSDAARYSTEGHDSPLFFDGAVVDGDPGLHFYPITYLWRTTPPVLLGLLLAATLGPGAGRWLLPTELRIAGRLVLFVAFFTLFLSLPAKKFDRYLLPVYPPADLVAALGWLAAGRWLQARIPALTRSAVPAMAFLAVAGQAACAAPAYPYYLSYYNPFVGGTPRAPAVMMVGWGEGLDQVARTLDALPNAEQLRVVSEYERGPLSYLFRGKALSPRTGDNANPDYRIVYINEIQRLEDPRELAYLAGRTPVQVVRIQGLEYALLYRLRE
ncbi:MAG TPA: hypothetical protein VER55_16935, partial [Ardenticatenaceae bacterium]|nr:hypothetical protein [Ardenticatenaceae bacterium]